MKKIKDNLAHKLGVYVMRRAGAFPIDSRYRFMYRVVRLLRWDKSLHEFMKNEKKYHSV